MFQPTLNVKYQSAPFFHILTEPLFFSLQFSTVGLDTVLVQKC